VTGGLKPSVAAVSSSLSTGWWNGISPFGQVHLSTSLLPAAAFVPASADFGGFVGETRIALPKTITGGRQQCIIGAVRGKSFCDLRDFLYFAENLPPCATLKPGWEICGDALDGKEAVARATELRPDLIILDYAMPRLDGFSAAKEIHKLLPTVPIVLHTLYASTELDFAANKFGIRRVVDKTKSGALISAVEELLSAP
jgi:CheY-like chemotaxis protein